MIDDTVMWDPEEVQRLRAHLNPAAPRYTAGQLVLLGASLTVCTLLGTLVALPLLQYWLAP